MAGKVFVAPDGREYVASTPREENDLRYGFGYVEKVDTPKAKAPAKVDVKPESKDDTKPKAVVSTTKAPEPK